MRRPLLAVMLMALLVGPLALSARAQPEVRVSMQASPPQVRVGETVRLQIEVKVSGGKADDIELPRLDGWQVISRQVSRPFQISFGFGSGSTVESTTLHVFTLRALREGRYEIEPAKAVVDGKTYASAPVLIEVTAAELPGDAPQGAPGQSQTAADEDGKLEGAKFDPTTFLQTVVEPKDPYVGQQVDVTVYLYTRVRMSSQSVLPSTPSMDGFWVQDIPLSELRWREVLVRGVPFRVAPIQRMAAFPQRTGALTVGAPKITFDAAGRSFFDAPERVERVGLPVEVEVRPLPQPGPANAVTGRYELSASLDRLQVKTGDALTLRVTASGRGNVQDMRLELPPIEGVRTLQPAIQTSEQLSGGAIVGKRVWEWILVPQTPGRHQIPILQLPFFDPTTESYELVATRPLSFESIGPASPEREQEVSSQAPTQTASRFGPIRTESELTRLQTPVRERTWFGWGLALPAFLFLGLVLLTTLRRRRLERRSKGGAVQRELLKGAGDALKQKDPRRFYDGIVASLTHALDERLPQRVGGLSHAELKARLEQQNFDPDLVNRIINELEGADFARFAASGVSSSEMEQCYRRTTALVERIQRVGGEA